MRCYLCAAFVGWLDELIEPLNPKPPDAVSDRIVDAARIMFRASQRA